MRTAVDTNIVVDILRASARHGERSADALRRCLREGEVVASVVVLAELRAVFATDEALRVAMSTLGIRSEPVDASVALAAGTAHQAYRANGGSRERVVADFLIGAHAVIRTQRLLTRDRGYYRTYFPTLTVLDPSIRA